MGYQTDTLSPLPMCTALWASYEVDLENKHYPPIANVHCWPQSTQGVGWLSVCTVLLITQCCHCHRVVSSHTLIPYLSCSNTRLTAACRLLFPSSVGSKSLCLVQTCRIIQVSSKNVFYDQESLVSHPLDPCQYVIVTIRPHVFTWHWMQGAQGSPDPGTATASSCLSPPAPGPAL